MNDSTIEFLEETLGLAAKELCGRFGSPMEIREKPDFSLVTDTDIAVEKLIIDRIKKWFPDDIIYAEESGKSSAARPPGGHVWIIDPLDGTTNFANRYPFFCSSVGRGQFRADGSIEMLAGGIVDPMRAKTYLGQTGKGATCNGQPIHVTAVADLKKAFLVTGFYYSKGASLSREISRLEKVAEVCTSIRRDGAAALDMALVAEGIYDGFWETGLAPWDVAAGSVLVREAGGVVANFDGVLTEPFNIETPTVVAANSAMASVLAARLN